MSDEDQTGDGSDSQMLTAEFKDGQLQIVEVTPFGESKGNRILPDMITGEDSHKYMQVLDPEKGLMQLDLLNLTLVRCEDGEESYRLVANGESDGSDLASDATVTCVLHSSDGEGENDNQASYVMMEGSEDQLMFLQSSLKQANSHSQSKKDDSSPKKALTPAEILEKAKALQKAKALMTQTSAVRAGKRGRKRKGDLPPPHELLSSPNFKLFLYSCKMCSFKCNAVKELTAHKTSEHSSGSLKFRSSGSASSRGSAVTLQCARCPFRGSSHSQLMKHVHEIHLTEFESNNKVSLDSAEVEAADVLVCGACGFESASRKLFRRHIEDEHGATTS